MAKEKVKGTQSIHRATLLMKTIARHNQDGVRLTDLAEELPLDRTTIHRIVRSLVTEKFISQDAATRRYFLGQRLFELGLAAGRRFKLGDIYKPVLARIAEKSGDTVFLSIRSGNDAVCIDRRNGTYPIKVFTLDVGDRRPLGTSASGIAILSLLPEPEVRRILSKHESFVGPYNKKPVGAKSLLAIVKRTHEQGYALYQGDLADVRAIAVALKDRNGIPFAAISVTAISSRMNDDRHREIIGLLKHGAQELEILLADVDVSSTLI